MVEKIKDFLANRKIADLRKYLEELNPVDIAEFIADLEEDELIIVYRLLSKDTAVEVFVELESELQEKLINAFTDKEMQDVVNDLFMDDVVDLIEEMPAIVVKRILKHINKNDRKTINELLKYPEDSAGSIMTTEFVDLKENMTVKEAFEKIRRVGVDKETIYRCYVLSTTRKLLGVLDVKELFFVNEDTTIKEIMEKDYVKAETMDDKEDVAKMFDKYNEIALPVVDKENRLVGIVTIDDAIDVMEEEAEEDFEIMAAVTPSDDTYFKTSVFKHAFNRIPWLLLLMLSSTLSGYIITKYESVFAAVPILVSFLPMFMGTGGNCGSQTSTLIIRGLALDEIKTKDLFKAIWKEIRVAVLVGIILFIVNFLRVGIQYHDFQIANIVAITIILTVILSKMLGCILPILAKKLKLDPAIMAAPIITTLVDISSTYVFFNIAAMILKI